MFNLLSSPYLLVFGIWSCTRYTWADDVVVGGSSEA